MIGRLSPIPARVTRLRTMASCAVLLMALWVAAPVEAQAGYDPWSQATLYRDAWGVPHVHAANPGALGFAVGWAQADDRIETLLRAYRLAQGRAAEVWGEEYAESDTFAIRMGHAELAAMAIPGLDAVTQAVCDGFAAGVNAWMRAYPEALPAWAAPVTPSDPLALLHYYLMTFAPFDAPGLWRPNPAAVTGNAWAVGPRRSRDGAGLLVINPHVLYTGPFQWYELHVVVQDLNVLGGTLVGLPLPLVGHNARVAWGLTPNQPDFADVYEDPPPTAERPPANVIYAPGQGLAPPQEMLWQQWVMMNTRSLYVNTPGGMESRSVVALRSPTGPLLSESPNGGLWSYRVGGYGDFGGLRQLWEMGRAQTMVDFRAALSLHQLPCFHIVYADADGNIFYRYNTKVGAKQDVGNPQAASLVEAISGGPAATSWRIPRDGRDLRYQWGPIIAPEELPTVVNPASGWVQASGSPPWEATTGLRWGREDLPRWLVHDRDTHRAQRVRHLLRSWEMTFQDAQSMVFDVVAPGAITAVPALLEAARAHPETLRELHPDLPAALAVLEAWNFVAEPHAAGMTVFHYWWQALIAMAGTDDSVLLARLAAIRSEERRKELLRAASDAAQTLRNQYGSVEVPWGEVHRIRRGGRVEGMPGGLAGEPVFTAAHAGSPGDTRVTYGFGYGLVVELGDPVRSVSLLPFGASDNPDSLHYDDQLELLLQRRFKRSPFELDAVQREANSAFGSSLFLRAPGVDGQLVVRTDRPVRARMVSFVEPPAPIPAGLAPFSLYAMPLIDAVEVRTRTTVEIRVPEALCRDEHLDSLAIYAFDGNTGWTRLPAQTLDRNSRAFLGEDLAARMVAVLGPSQLRLRAPDPERVPRPDGFLAPDEGAPIEPLMLAEARPTRRGPTVGELGMLEPLPETRASGPPLQAPVRETPPSPPPERPVALPISTEQVETGGQADLLGLLQFLQPQQTRDFDVDETPQSVLETPRGRIEFLAPPPPRRETVRPVVAPDKPPVAPPVPDERTLVTEGGGFLQIGKPSETPAPPPERVATAAGPAAGATDASPARREGELRPMAIGNIARGTEMVVRAPRDTAFFQINAPETISARAAVLDGPPSPFPAGWVHFSEVVAVEFDPPDAAVAMTVTVQVPRGACVPTDIPKLVLHAYTRERGWQPVLDQQVSVPGRTFSCVGTRALAYAVLGTESLRPTGVGR